ncbi:MAG: DUF4190 domain-containing protein [Demequina sp.]
MAESDSRDAGPTESPAGDPPPVQPSPNLAAGPVVSVPTPAAPASAVATPAHAAGSEGAGPGHPATVPTAATPHEGEAQVLDPVDDQPTQVIAPVPEATREAPPSIPPGGDDDRSAERDVDRNWIGVGAFVTGALFLSLVAIVLGHLGLSAAKRGRADNRQFSIAGLILGYLGLIVTAAGVWFLVAGPVRAGDVDIQAQQDVSAVGAAAASLAAQTADLPVVSQTDAGYSVGDQAIVAELTTAHELGFAGSGPADWCLEIVYEGGTEAAFHYTATSAMAPGLCPATG